MRARAQYKKDGLTHVLFACESNIYKLMSFHSTCFRVPLFAERILSFNRAVNPQQMQLSCHTLIATWNSQLFRETTHKSFLSTPFLQVLTSAVNLLYDVHQNFRAHSTIESYVTYNISPNKKPDSFTEIAAQKSRIRLISQALARLPVTRHLLVSNVQ